MSKDRLLVIDIGNTNLVLGVFEGQDLRHSWRVVTRREQTADEYAVLFRNLFAMENLTFSEIGGIAVCSVVPPVNEAFQRLADRHFKLSPFFVEPEKQRLVSVRYRPVADVGADRIVTALAAYRMFGGPAIVVDFGTATTFDAISEAGEYLGGVIAPGIGISAEALFQRAAKLPRVDIRKPARVIGDSTIGSMQSGLYFGYVGLVEGILKRMKSELKADRVVSTGGMATLLAADVEGIDHVEENLMLFGLRMFYEHLQTGK